MPAPRPLAATSPPQRGPRAAFSLIELIIVVGLISILVAIAIPNFLRFQLRAKATEGKVNLASIAKAEEGYFAAHGTYVTVAAPVPAALPGGGRTPWVNGTAFDNFGWAPEGDVYFVYLVTADNPGAGSARVRFTAEAASDIDGDGALNFWGHVKPALGANSGIPGGIAGSTCQATGVYDRVSTLTNVLATVGPCDASSGTSRF